MTEEASRTGTFPVLIKVGGFSLWFGWVDLCDGKNFLWHINRHIIWATQKSQLEKFLSEAGRSLDEPESAIDLDLVLRELRQGQLNSHGQALDSWNIFTDFLFTISELAPGPYEPDELELYDKLFSHSHVAGFMDMERETLDAADLARLSSIIEAGARMILDNTIRNRH